MGGIGLIIAVVGIILLGMALVAVIGTLLGSSIIYRILRRKKK